jgi:hypothetical protein
MAVKVTVSGGSFDPKKIVRDATKKIVDAAADRVRRARCDVHGETPREVRVMPAGTDQFRVSFKTCCDALRDKAQRAAGGTK